MYSDLAVHAQSLGYIASTVGDGKFCKHPLEYNDSIVEYKPVATYKVCGDEDSTLEFLEFIHCLKSVCLLLMTRYVCTRPAFDIQQLR